MADFFPCFDELLQIEGGYAPDDAGAGPVKFGVNARFLKALGLPYDAESVRNMTVEDVQAIYQRVYWDRHRIGQFFNQALAQTYFIGVVNLPTKRANKYLQDAVNLITKSDLKVDGVIGPMTVAALNRGSAKLIRWIFQMSVTGWYRYLAETYPEKHRKHLEGWLWRVQH